MLCIACAVVAVFTVSLQVADAALIELSPAPSSVVQGQLENNTSIYWFSEGQHNLSSDLAVDIAAPGTYDDVNDLPTTKPVISSGTSLRSYYFHFDPVGTGSTVRNATGTLTFENDILGILLLDASLDGTDALFSLSGTTYPSGMNYRGLEYGRTGYDDSVTIDIDLRTLNLDLFASNAGVDQLRVLTAVPIPSATWLLGSGLIGLVFLRRKIKKKIN
jgi:hypothetical protein